MSVACPRCEQEPAPDAQPGSRCAGCGAELVVDLAGESRGHAALDLDPRWQQEKAAARAGQTMAGKRRPPRLIAGTIVALLLIGLVAVGIVVIVQRDHPRSPTNLPGVSIYIRAVGSVEVTIDGKRAGTTPLTYTAPRSSTPIVIEAPSIGAVEQVVPDRDRDVFLAR
jgi:hypothetical protein